MAVTIMYIIIGLALATIAIEIAADTLRKLHYFRRTIKHVGNIQIWFGGKRLTVRQIIHNLCDHFNVPDAALTDFNIGNFVEQAIKVEAGELPSFRNQSSRREASFNQKNELLIQASKLPESESEFEPEPEIILLPKPEQELEPELVEEPEPKSELIQKLEPIPEYEAELEFLPEPQPCFPVFAISEATLPCELLPGTEESELVSGLEPQFHRLELSEEAEEIPYKCETPTFTVLEPMPPLESMLETTEVLDAEMESELRQGPSLEPEEAAVKEPPENMKSLQRKGYSEKFWKLYREYQNEWSKFHRLTRTSSCKDRQRSLKEKSIKKLPNV